jgi:hypothetical protein
MGFWLNLGALVLLAACNSYPPKDESEDPGITGKISLDERSGSSRFEVFKAFAYDTEASEDAEGKFIAFLSSNSAATCEDASAYMSGDEEVEKDRFMRGGRCVMTIIIEDPNRDDGDLASETGDLASDSGGEVDVVANTLIECEIGNGAFKVREAPEDDEYWWTGKWWTGAPVDFAWKINGGDGKKTFMEMSMSAYTGGLPNNGQPDGIPASGTVTGKTFAEWCPGLAGSPDFE